MSQQSSPSGPGALSTVFQVCRVLQLALLIAALGTSASVVSALVNSAQRPSGELIGTLCAISFALLYAIITSALHFDRKLPPLVASALDTFILGALAATSVLARDGCAAVAPIIPTFDPRAAFTDVQYAAPQGGTVVHREPGEEDPAAAAGAGDCVLVTATCGIVGAAALLFAVSAVCLGVLWWRARRENRQRMDEEAAAARKERGFA